MSASGELISCHGTLKTTVRVGTFTKIANLYIIDGIGNKLLLANKFFWDHIIYDRGRRLLFPNSEHKPVNVYYKRTIREARAIHSVTIPPNSIQRTKTKVKRSSQMNWKLVMVDQHIKGIPLHSSTSIVGRMDWSKYCW